MVPDREVKTLEITSERNLLHLFNEGTIQNEQRGIAYRQNIHLQNRKIKPLKKG